MDLGDSAIAPCGPIDSRILAEGSVDSSRIAFDACSFESFASRSSALTENLDSVRSCSEEGHSILANLSMVYWCARLLSVVVDSSLAGLLLAFLEVH